MTNFINMPGFKLDMVEQIIEVDENDNQIGLRPKCDFFKSKHIHRASHLILFNSKDEILLQHRMPTKKVWPDLFTFSVDCTVADESYEECIQREMQEEIGISIDVKRLFNFPYFGNIDKARHCVFFGRSDDKIIPDKREIQMIKWIDADELKDDILKNPGIYVPPFVEGMKKYFDEFYRTEK